MKWKSIGEVLFSAVKVMVPKIQEVEDDIKAAKSGPDKKAAVIKAGLDALAAAQDVSGKQFMNDPRVAGALGKVNDALVEAHKVIAFVSARTENPGNE